MIKNIAPSVQFPDNVIDPLVHQAAIELGYIAGAECRKLMLETGMTEAEADEVIRKAFEWRHKNN